MNKKFSVIPLMIISIILYLILAAIAHISLQQPTIFAPTRFAYYNYLIEAFLNGRTYVLGTASHHDLSLFHNKWYLYWGPAPVLFILPFYIIWGVQASDVVYTLVAGICSIYLFYLIVKECIAYWNLRISQTGKVTLIAGFAFTSPHVFLTIMACVWFTNQIIATFYLLISYLFYFKYLRRSNKLVFLVLSVIFFNLAWFSRYLLIFNILLYIYPIFLFRRNILDVKKILFIVAGITIMFLSLYGYYNYIRFGNVFETGHTLQLVNTQEVRKDMDKKKALRYETLQKQGKSFGWEYVPQNMIHYFFHHASLSFKRPFINIDADGDSIVSVYPIFLLIGYLFQRKYFRNSNNKILISIMFLIISVNMLLLLGYVTSGWMQFGSRYFMDVVPLLMILMTIVIDDVPYALQYTLLVYGIVINILGISHYFHFF